MVSNAAWHPEQVTPALRARRNGHPGRVVWLTGLSGAGKSTLAHAVELALHQRGYHTVVLDGDDLRKGLCQDLGFSASDRSENVRRIAEAAKLFVNAGLVVLVACISPMRQGRERAKAIIGAENFLEVWLDCPLEVCETRDAKGLYRRARTGELREFTGISSAYEPPQSADLVLHTAEMSIADSVAQVTAQLS